jgi:nitrate reductase assembly molybdenum cofactor insertion protein NarJ
MALAHYDQLARLFAHPGPSLDADLTAAIACHADACPEAARALRTFAEQLPLDDPIALQELYTRTFDVQPITSLDIGYTLFGEDYKRGALLANLSGEHTRAGNDCGAELADHLTNVLRLLPRMADTALREEFVGVMLVPALRAMIREFDPARMARKEEIYRKHHKTIIETAGGETRTAYRHALEAIASVLQADFGIAGEAPVEPRTTFACSVGVEMDIETCGPCAASPSGVAR